MSHVRKNGTGGLKPRVFIVQQTVNRGFDYTPAEEYGDLVYILGKEDVPWHPEAAINKIRKALSDYDGSRDWIIPVGNSCFIFWVGGIASSMSPMVQILRWHNVHKEYVPVRAEVLDDWEDEDPKRIWHDEES